MKLIDQVCSLELAKKLKELGVKQEGYWDWKLHSVNGEKRWSLTDDIDMDHPAHGCASAFTVAELGEMLKTGMKRLGGKVVLNVPEERVRQLFHRVMNGISDNEAEDRAQMLVYLLENKLITV